MVEDGEENVKDLKLRIVLLKKVTERKEGGQKNHTYLLRFLLLGYFYS